MAETFIRIASSISINTLSFKSVRIDVPASERRQIGFVVFAGIVDCRIPRVHIKQSAYSIKGTIFKSIRSKPEVGPMMKPWSKASITALPVFGLKIRDRRSFIPQGKFSAPFTWKLWFSQLMPKPKSAPSLKSSKSAIFIIRYIIIFCRDGACPVSRCVLFYSASAKEANMQLHEVAPLSAKPIERSP